MRVATFACVALALALGGCGKTTVVRERPLVVTGTSPAPDAGDRPTIGSNAVRIAVVTHGQASSPFWAVVRNGVDAAERQTDVVVRYRAPEVYSLARMKALIREAVDSRPDGLVVSIPEKGVEPAIRAATRAGVPTVSINSGSDVARSLGVIAHVGQPEEAAGFKAGRRLTGGGARRVVCVNEQVGNVGLDARCRGLARALRDTGGRASVLAVDDESSVAPRRIADAVLRTRADAVLTLNSTTATEAVAGVRAIRRSGSVRIATFDLGPDVLKAVRDGSLAFAVDQQAYLQGYLPVVLLAQRARYGLAPAQGAVIPTGPSFVTRRDAARTLELSERSIR